MLVMSAGFIAFMMMLSFGGTFLATKLFILYCRKAGLMAVDRHKSTDSKIPSSGGMPVLVGIFTAIFFYVLFNNDVRILAVMLSMLIVTVVGLMDDFAKLSGGLRQWTKPLLTLPAAIPLIVLVEGDTTMLVPFIGLVNFGLVYHLLIIPIGVIGASNMVNMLAGYNGLEAGMGVIYTTTLAIIAYQTGAIPVALIGFVTAAALMAFLIFNWYPSKIFPGDSLTYLLGAVIACMAIAGNMEKAAIICSIPFLIEFVLKLRSKFKAESFSRLVTDGKLLHNGPVYSLPHILTNTGKFTEQQVVIVLMVFEFACCVLAVLV